MSIKLRPTVVYKAESDQGGILFSIGDDSNKVLKMTGLVNHIVKQLSEGIDMNAIKARILTEYEVDETQLIKDIQGLKEKLTELEFLDN